LKSEEGALWGVDRPQAGVLVQLEYHGSRFVARVLFSMTLDEERGGENVLKRVSPKNYCAPFWVVNNNLQPHLNNSKRKRVLICLVQRGAIG
jgi:hypothetical protein